MDCASQPVLRTGGVFHFGKRNEEADPIASLRSSLRDPSVLYDLRECIVVLPEAFNVRGDYWTPGRRHIDGSITAALKEVSIEFGVALVAGLVENENGRLGCNSAYLIDGGANKLLSRKMIDDGSGVYKPCTENCDQPLVHRGVCLAALICVDGLQFNRNSPSRRQAQLLLRMSECKTGSAVLCLPAHTLEYYTPGVALSWPSYLHILVANSHHLQPSVIRRSGGSASETEHKGTENKICLASLI
jgi:hypothetical protein